MNAYEFFWLVANMRQAQQAYFDGNKSLFRKCRALEGEVDREIRRVKEVLEARGDQPV